MMATIRMGDRVVGNGQPVFIVAEAGINHNGNIEKAKELIDAAAECGADAVKFQTHIAEKEMLKTQITADYIGESIYDLIKRMELSREYHLELMDYARKRGIIFFSTPFSKEAADLLDALGVPVFKIGSGEMTNLPLVAHIAGKRKPIIISTGMSTMEEIDETVRLLKSKNAEFVLMHCTSTYPTKYEDVALGVMQKLKERFGVPVGLSDHSVGIYTALAAVALGACVVEKHFTISRDWPGPDQKASIEPSELRELVKGVRAIEKAMGSTKRVIADEVPVQAFARESVVAVADIRKGEIIGSGMVWVKRPGTGIPAKELDKIIGRKAARDIQNDTLLAWDDIE